ncbi:MAG: hypothetical protein RL385_4469, partial [Pseudomonadota bacterium]
TREEIGSSEAPHRCALFNASQRTREELRMSRWIKVAGFVLGSAMALGELQSAQAQSTNYLDQGWASADRQYFYRTSQGSRLISYRLIMALEANWIRDSSWVTGKFMSPEHLGKLGFVFDAAAANNPDGLPIGVVKDTSVSSAPDHVGFTCATCHTRDVSFKSGATTIRYRIDGGQSYVDMESFLQKLETALYMPFSYASEFDKLCVALGATTTAAKAQVRTELNAAYKKISEENLANRVPGQPNNPGPGRVDAFAHIKNRVANTVFPGQFAFAGNNIDASAPVSYPFLWDTPYLDHVQYPANTPNANIGSLARNVGEVTGVFAETKSNRTLGVFTATSTANIGNLLGLEDRLLRLKSPQWPSGVAPLNQTLVAQGDALFKTYCASCHVEVDRNPRTKWIPVYAVGQSFVKTDDTQTFNNVNDKAFAGQISADASRLVNPLEILGYVGANIVLPELWRGFELQASHKQSGAPAAAPTKLPDGTELLAPGEAGSHVYKSRPMNGIWATGPYLHNGSVRTLADLLLPGVQRPSTFCVGSIEIDTVGVGMKNDCTLQGAYTFDAKKAGNLATGHEYGTADDYRVKSGQLPVLTAPQRAALVEYMKTL